MLDTHVPWSSPSCNLSPTQPPCPVQIQSTVQHGFRDISLILRWKKCILLCSKKDNDVVILVLVLDLEGLWIILCDHDVGHLFGPT